MRKKRSEFELNDYVCPMSPVVSTRNKIKNMIQESKNGSSVNQQSNEDSKDEQSALISLPLDLLESKSNFQCEVAENYSTMNDSVSSTSRNEI